MATNHTKFSNHFVHPSGSGCVIKLTSKEVDTQGMANTDTIELFKIPKGAIPIAALVEITESAGEARTIDIGDSGGDVDGILDGVDLNNTAGTLIQTALGADLSGGLITLATGEATIIASCITGTAYAAGKFKVHLWVVN